MSVSNHSKKICHRKLNFLVDDGYRVGEDGSVWSRRKLVPLTGKGNRGFVCILTNKWKQLKPGRSGKYKHLTIALRTNGKMRSHYVHRLVLLAFVGSCPENMECRHLDGNPSNNNLDNLCWGTAKENSQDMIKHGKSLKGKPGVLKGERIGNSRATTTKVLELRKLHATGKYTCIALSKMFELPCTTIYPIIEKRTWKHLL